MGSINNRMIAVMRLVMASAILLIFFLDSTWTGQSVASPSFNILIFYTLFSLVLYLFEFYERPLIPAITAHWVDVGWYALLIAVSNDVNSIYLYGFFFSILIASFRWGFKSGLQVVIVSAALFIIIGMLPAPVRSELPLNQFLIRPIFLVALGFMIAYWGGLEIKLKRRLALLREVNTLSNPRFGVDRTIGSVMERLRSFYEADVCLLVMSDLHTAELHLRRADRRDPEKATHAQPASEQTLARLTTLPASYGVVRRGRWCRWFRVGKNCYAIDLAKGTRVDIQDEKIEELATALDASSFITVPLRYRNEEVGRIFLTSSRPVFESSDVSFIVQVFDQVLPIIDNIRLVDRLALDAAEYERQKIARDIHDSVIQPYIGLQIGLSAIRQKLHLGIDVTGNVERLLQITGEEVADLRQFVSTLKANGRRSENLLPAVQRFADKFGKVSGIKIYVEATSEICINDRLAAEAFQMIAEGLSNIRRHTESQQADIEMSCQDGQLTLHIKNYGGGDAADTSFVPRSITERAVALGGQASVRQTLDGGTVVAVEIPL